MLNKVLHNIYNRIFPTNLVMSTVYYLKNEKPRLKIMTPQQSIAYIEKTNCSVARFGEGEFELILWPERNLGFQNHNDELEKRLEGVLASKNSNLLICIPYALNNIWGRTQNSRNFWYYWSERKEQRKLITNLIKKYHGTDKVFGDTQISRPYIAWPTSKNADDMFPKLMNLWKDKDIIIVEGVKTRLGVGNDLFTGAKSIKRILGPATNAFDYCDEIREKIEEIRKDELVILALGPTATIIASDLADRGIRAIDIGHLDIEYEWYLNKATGHDIVPGKFTNEAEKGNDVEECNDEWYLSQIVTRVRC